jgi:hypothetical protein
MGTGMVFDIKKITRKLLWEREASSVILPDKELRNKVQNQKNIGSFI